jgi:hypothetical protein
LEKNYIGCILQKALKDRTIIPTCNLDKVLYYHLECPDYVKKFDNPKTNFYLKRQLFNLLVVPYVNSKLVKAYDNLPKDIKDKEKSMPYPEEIKTRSPVQPFDNNVLKRYVQSADFQADEPRE